MPRFKPGQRTADRSNRDELLPQQQYLLAFTWFQRKISSAGNEYFSVKCTVVAGRMKGKSFFSMLMLDLTKEATERKWSLLADSFELTEEIELGSGAENTAREGDENFRKFFMHRPFMAEVWIKQDPGYAAKNDIRFILDRKKWPGQAEGAASRYLDERRNAPESNGGGDDGASYEGDFDDYEGDGGASDYMNAPPPGTGVGSRDEFVGDDPGEPPGALGDDDIPF